MSDFVGFLEGAEKLAYKILVWIILIPKTLWRVIVNPDWVPGFINKELKQEKSAFDEYISPIILLLVVALVPILIIFLLPDLNLAISSPAETEPTTQRVVQFDAEATFISGSTDMRDQYTWFVEVIEMDGTGRFVYDENDYPIYYEIYRETYNELTDITTITYNGDPEQTQAHLHQQNTSLIRDRNSSLDTFSYWFDIPGAYFVNVEVVRFDTKRQDVPVESYAGSTYMYVVVPANPEEAISITNYAPKVQSMEWGDVFSERFTILIALASLTPPLLFAFAIRVLTRQTVGEKSLKENFYIQCYYFSPLSLTFWATLYGWYFYTIDIFSYNSIYGLTLFLPLTWAAIWFLYAETYAVAAALKTSLWKGFLAVATCVSIMIGLVCLAIFVAFFDQNDALRKGLIWAYPLLFHLALLGLILIRFFSWVAGLSKLSFGDALLFLLFLPSMFFFVGGNLLGVIAVPETAVATVEVAPILLVDSTATSAPATPVVTSPPVVVTGIPVLLPNTGVNPATYVMHRGEFPYCLARRFDIHPDDLLASNGFVNGQGIPAGTTFNIPQSGRPFPGNRSLRTHPTIYVVISADETLYNIACLFGDIDPAAIATVNGIPVDAALAAGQQLQIP